MPYGAVSGRSKELEGGALEDVRDVVESHAIARVGLVGTIRVHGVPVRHAAKRQLHRDPYLAEGVGERLLEHTHDIILRDEAHLDIHLRELGLAVRAQVLVAKAPGDLVVALDATHHEELVSIDNFEPYSHWIGH